MTGLWIVLAIVVVIVIALVAVYNGLITRRNRVFEALSDIDVQLKRRYDLIPNLVNTVKGYATHERELFEKVTAERAGLMTGTTGEKIAASNQLTETLKSLFAVAEAYPDLKANQNFLSLQVELTDTQDKIMAAQRFYNSNVRDFNTAIQVFPTNLLAAPLGFSAFEFIEATPTETQNVQVNF
ncbi:MAG: LemA family protein [Coriobacteriia bacterium]|nr:LemA family protein [Coriobacteriia bacterium]